MRLRRITAAAVMVLVSLGVITPAYGSGSWEAPNPPAGQVVLSTLYASGYRPTGTPGSWPWVGSTKPASGPYTVVWSYGPPGGPQSSASSWSVDRDGTDVRAFSEYGGSGWATEQLVSDPSDDPTSGSAELFSGTVVDWIVSHALPLVVFFLLVGWVVHLLARYARHGVRQGFDVGGGTVRQDRADRAAGTGVYAWEFDPQFGQWMRLNPSTGDAEWSDEDPR